ncbi:MAG TPA: sigma-E factor negative regulatory protein [Rhodocyclaceae bacterium]|nr:sigma-E factor negative regulatory protein [Rhodocyclaceae bacterium]
MKSRLSALLDGEADESDVSECCEALRCQSGLQDDVMTYALIGACLRGEHGETLDMTARVMAALAAEPVVMAPKRTLWKSGGVALAASMAGALVLASVVLVPDKGVSQVGYTLVHSSGHVLQAGTWAANDASMVGMRETDVREYVIAHEAQSRGSYVGGGSQQIRTVSMLDESASR